MSIFEGLWPGGYLEGDPLDPSSSSTYNDKSYMSILHATYLRCIKPYLDPTKTALEIGAGRGAWTKCLLPFKEVHVLEVLSEEETGIREYLQYPSNLVYHKIDGFACRELRDYKFEYMFSFGCMCHITPTGLLLYAHNLFPKMQCGCNCFWMISDYKMTGLPPDKNDDPFPGRWYDNGLDRTCTMLERVGYTVFQQDVGTALRDPIIHFGRI